MLTGTLTKEQVQAVIKMALDAKGQRKPDFSWDRCKEVLQVGEGRAWLIVRRAELERLSPELLIDVDALEARAKAELKAQDRLSEYNPLDVLSPIVKDLYLGLGQYSKTRCSWGEIMVRLDRAEPLVRKAFRHQTIVKDRGLRIGKGGRFAYGAGNLYTEHRKGEGIAIPVDLKGRPASVEVLVNGEHAMNRPAIAKGAKVRKPAAKKAARKPKVAKVAEVATPTTEPMGELPTGEQASA